MLRRVLVLGSIEVTIDGAPVELGGPKQQLVLAMLAAARGEPVSLSRIVDGVWADEAPARAEASVQSYISNLRRLLEPDRARGAASLVLPLEPGGYRLSSDLVERDADRFEELAADGHELLGHGRPLEASAALAEALALWRGGAFGAMADNPVVLPEAARLEELRWRATEDRWTAELALSRHERAVPELRALTQTDPLRERSWVLLATALARSGRQVDALRAVRDGMAALGEAAGLEPGTELAALERSLLEQDADVEASPSRPLAAPFEPGGVELVARLGEYEVLRTALDAADAGDGRAVIISGEAGIGKTFLTRRLADHAAARGWAVGWGRCPEGADVPGLWPLREALSGLARELPDGALGTRLGPGTDLGPLTPGADVVDGASSTFAIGAALLELLHDVSRRRPCLVVLDDAHWADAGTLRVIRHVVAGLDHHRVLVVVTHRDTDPRQRETLAPLRADVARSPGGVALALEGLSVESVRALVDRDVSSVTDADIAELHRRTGGNPFFITELVRSGGGAAPTGVRDVVRRQLDAVPDAARAVVDALAVAGEEADVHLVADVCGLAPADVLDALDRATDAGLVRESDRPNRSVFAHDVIRETAYDELRPAARARLHHATELAIERRWGDDAQHLSARAWHAWMGSAASDPRHVLDIVRLAATAADDAHRLDEAVERWRWAAELVDTTGSPADRFSVLASYGQAIVRAGDVHGSREPLLRAGRLAMREGRWEDAADVMTTTSELSLWLATAFGQVDADVIEALEQTLDHLEPSDHERRALVGSRLALELYYSDDEVRIDRCADAALEHARLATAPRVLAVVLSQRYAVKQRPHLIGPLLEVAEELRELGSVADLEPGEIEAITGVMRGFVRMTLGQLDEAAGAMAAADRVVASGRLPYLAAQLRWYHVTRLIVAGHLDAAEAAFHEAEAFYSRVIGLESEPTAFIVLFGLRLEQGRPEELLDALRHLVDDLGREAFADVLLVLLLDAGLVDEARERASRDARHERSRDWIWLSVTCARAWVESRLRNVEACRSLFEVLLPYSGQVGLTGQLPPSWGAVDLFLGLLAEATGDTDGAQSYLRAAVELNEALGARSWLARSLAALARVLDASGAAPGEPPGLRARAAHLAHQVGSPVLIAQVSEA